MIEGDRIQHRDYCPAWIAIERRTCPEHHTNEAHHPDGRACGVYPPAREHHDEATDALIVEALREAMELLGGGCNCASCYWHRPARRSLEKVTAALKAMGK